MLHQAYAYATEYVDGVTDRPVFPSEEALEALGGFDAPLPQEGLSGIEMLERLNRLGAPATTAQIGGRYFAFVNGGDSPAFDGCTLACRQLGPERRALRDLTHRVEARGGLRAADC